MIKKQVTNGKFIAVEKTAKEITRNWYCNCCGTDNLKEYYTVQIPSSDFYCYFDMCPDCRGLLLQALREEA
jgi:hypothetical protein